MTSTTRNEASVADDESYTVTRSISIAAPAEKVWRAITEPEHLSRWFGLTVLDAAGAGTMTFDGHGAVPIRVESVDAPRSVSYRWSNDNALDRLPVELDEENSTVFRFTLEPEGEGTRLTVVESGFERTSDPLSNLDSHRRGWDAELDKLIALFGGLV
ncbi:SRPBCC domain-containing protein [Microbacterium sp. Au-Mic1]|uniref:SRPBCC domain-containing protein n=1 Tax=Microbacterium sp. Au-Mic1 TaxID=2906457 RepID=UPI001E37949D|nr:SRPBCC domain-containing protein [Microbacterium sp. Au-Mic1]MCE4025213.1 SRPBCC domain-containing protein [Microbacterium sp. Au-Mic1]